MNDIIHWISADPSGTGNITGCGKPHVFPMRGNGWRVRDITCPDCDRAICDIVHAQGMAPEGRGREGGPGSSELPSPVAISDAPIVSPHSTESEGEQ